MEKKKDIPQKSALRKMMGNYLKVYGKPYTLSQLIAKEKKPRITQVT